MKSGLRTGDLRLLPFLGRNKNVVALVPESASSSDSVCVMCVERGL